MIEKDVPQFQTTVAAGSAVSADAIEAADVCQEPADFEGVTGRVVMGLVLRRYFDAMTLTPFELLFGYRALKAFADSEGVVTAALAKVAAAQSRARNEDPRQRRAALQGVLETFLKRTREADGPLGKLAGPGPGPGSGSSGGTLCEACLESLSAAGKDGGGDAVRTRLGAALCRDMATQRTWLGRIDFVLDLAGRQSDPRLAPLLDDALADHLCAPGAAAAVLGTPPVLGDLMFRLLRVCHGDEAVSSGPGRIATLSLMFRQGRLPGSRAAVLEWCQRRLRASDPLAARESGRETELFNAILNYLVTADGVEGGSRMAEALTLRAAKRSPQGGNAGLRLAMITVSESLSDMFRRLHYLIAVGDAPGLSALTDEVMAAILSALGNEMLVEGLLFRSGALSDLRSRLNRLSVHLRGSGFPPADRDRLAGRLDYVIDEYALSGRLFTHLGAIDRQPGRQALRLSEIVESGLIHADGALPLIKQRLLEIIRRSEAEAGGGQKGRPRPAQERAEAANGPGGAGAGAGGGGGAGSPLAPLQFPPGPADALTQVQIGLAGSPTLFTRSPALRPAAPAGPGRPRPAVPRLPPAVRAAPAPVAAPAAHLGRRCAPDEMTELATEMATAFAGRPVGAAGTPTPGASPAPVASSAAARRRKAAPDDQRCPNCFAVRQPGGIGSAADGTKCPECGYDPAAERRATNQLTPGTELQDRYRTGRLLGQGGFGITYLGWDDRLRIKVAIKEYFPVSLVSRAAGGSDVLPFTQDHADGFYSGIVKFLEEARILARLRDMKEIVGVQDFFEENNTAYLVMELLEGRTLKKMIQDSGGKLEYRRALALLAPIMKALHEIHATGLVHRDVSPDNIFLTSAGECRLLDFGAARQAVGEATGALTVILKPGYAPPEQYAHDGRQGPWTDVYAMAATLFCAITGKVPPDVAKRFQKDQISRPSELGFGTPQALDDVLIGALSLRVQERPQSMKELLAALTRALG